MKCFQEAAAQNNLEFDLDAWMEKWLQVAGVNVLTPLIEQ